MIVPLRRLAVFVIIFVVLSACAAPENSDEGSGDAGGPAPGDAIKIGVNIELSGRPGSRGRPIRVRSNWSPHRSTRQAYWTGNRSS